MHAEQSAITMRQLKHRHGPLLSEKTINGSLFQPAKQILSMVAEYSVPHVFKSIHQSGTKTQTFAEMKTATQHRHRPTMSFENTAIDSSAGTRCPRKACVSMTKFEHNTWHCGSRPIEDLHDVPYPITQKHGRNKTPRQL